MSHPLVTATSMCGFQGGAAAIAIAHVNNFCLMKVSYINHILHSNQCLEQPRHSHSCTQLHRCARTLTM
jgi:hypothetical protein